MVATAFIGAKLGCGAFLGGRPLQQRAPMRSTAPLVPATIEAAHKKGAGSTKNGRDSNSKSRGVKVYGGQPVPAGGIIIRQLGTKVRGDRAGGNNWPRCCEHFILGTQEPALGWSP